MRILLLLSALTAPLFAQLDTSTLNDNTWVNVWNSAAALSISGNNWAYENDLHAHPFYGFFVMGPGHVTHPQDCYFYPFDPVKKAWTKINSPRRSPRRCLGSFAISSQDTFILQLGGGEGSHQQGQGAWNGSYSAIDLGGKRGIRLWAYSFNRNQWYNMNGPVSLPKILSTPLPQYDPVHDIVLLSQGDSLWLYHFQSNTSKLSKTPANFPEYFYSCAVDERRGLYYVLSQGILHRFDPETEQWSTIPGTQPPTPGTGAGSNGIGLNMLAYDNVNDVMVYAGDDNAFGAPSLNTWVFYCDSLKWAKMTTPAAPQDRGRLAYNRALNAFMLLGGAATSDISRGGGTQGVWAYRYKRGPGVFAGKVAAPAATVTTTNTTPVLNWNAVSGSQVTGYNIYRGTANPFPKNFQKLNSSPLAATTYSDPSATASTYYAYKICAVSNGNEGEMSRILYTKPGRVLGVVASVEDTPSVRVSWEANPAGEVVGYNIYRSKGASMYAQNFPANGVKVNGAPVTALEFTDTILGGKGFADGVARGYVVTAVNGLGVESGVSNECTTFPDSPEWAWTFPVSTPQGTMTSFRWQPPRRTKILGVNLYRVHEDQPVDSTLVTVVCGGGSFYFPTLTYATRLNGTKAAPAPITDSVSTWPLPPAIIIPPGTDKTGYYLQGQTYIARAVNIFGQEGFCSDEISPNNQEYGFGMVAASQRFNYDAWRPSVAVETGRVTSPARAALDAWPNPFNPALNVAFRAKAGGRAEIRLMDVAGRCVRSETVPVRSGLNTGALTKLRLGTGIYVVQVRCEGRILQKTVALLK